MSEIKITTLKSVHIGDGNFLQQNVDFFKALDSEGYEAIFLTDERKILDLIGVENLDNWVLSIERSENVMEFMKRIVPKCQPVDFSKRVMPLYGSMKRRDTLKTHIHDGLGRAYIPGSSLKGAIRTAVFASLVKNVPNTEEKIINRRGVVTAEMLEGELFGSKANESCFRFLQVGDAIFEEGSEIVVRLRMGMNITTNDDLTWQNNENGVPNYDRKPQLAEVIREQEKAVCRMKIVQPQNKSLPVGMRSLPELFETINSHTERLLKKEIKFWEEMSQKFAGTEDYLVGLRDLLEEVNRCESGKSCVLRLGHASGWDFITGGWAKDLNNFESRLVGKIRMNNSRYGVYPFPKSRRLDEEFEVLGFVKMSL